MNTYQKMKLIINQAVLTRAMILLSLLFTSTTFGQTAGVIGMKFGFAGGYATSDQLALTDQAGAVAVTNWNNLLANVQAPQGNAERAAAINITWNIAQDSAGNALSGVTLTPAGFNDGWFSGGTGCANGRLLYDCWKFNTGNGQTDGGGKSYVTFIITNLPAAAYDVYAYINDNNGNYWGNVQANSVIAVGSNIDSNGFNGASSDPCSLGTPLHTAGGFGVPANYVKMPAVATVSGGVITVTVAMIGGGDFGVSGIELVPLSTDPAKPTLIRDTLPTYAETVVGDQVVFTAAFSNSPPANLQWQFVSGGVTNDIAGATSATLTLNNVQLAASGSYQLKAINATNSGKVSYSTAEPLVVGNTPAAVNNIIVNYAGQTFGAGANFYPAWPISTNNNLIYGFPIGGGSPGTSVPGAGNFGDDATFGDPTILTDGMASGSKSSMVSCGPTFSGDGDSMTYYLITNSAPNGFELTNITVFGGWTDGGRNEQKYQVLYSTVATPGTFVPLVTADYNPTDTTGAASVTRTTLISATPNGALAHNVAAVKFNFNVSPAPKNNWEGYSEIIVNGAPSVGVAPTLAGDITPQTAVDVAGSQLVMTAGFNNFTSLQWKKNGTNILGATAPTLTLNNLQLSDAAAYTLVASNAAGTTSSSACALTVNPAPAPVGNIVTAYAAQSAPYTSFAPTWDASALHSSLIYGVAPSSSGNGDFTGVFDGANGSGPSVLTDGTFGFNDFPLSGSDASFSAIGSNPGAGNFVTYTLAGSTNGYDITNITTFGGWNDGGRDQQAYTVYYSTVADPATFVALSVVNYNPAYPNGISFDRATITPASGLLANNVAALKFDMTSPAGENGWSGYSEISVYGSPSAPLVVPPPIGSVTLSGGNLVVTGTGGYPPNGGYTLLSTTNLTPPIIWQTNSSGVLDGTGAFSNSIPINPAQPARFFRLRMP